MKSPKLLSGIIGLRWEHYGDVSLHRFFESNCLDKLSTMSLLIETSKKRQEMNAKTAKDSPTDRD
eukprot:2523900-Amphidinium_carterae.1